MKNLATSIVRFLREEDGPTAVEYAVMLMCIILVCIATIRAVGTATADNYAEVTLHEW